MHSKKQRTVLLSLALAAPLASAGETGADAFDLSLEELMQVVVTSVSKKSQTLAETAAAVHVISAEDIRRSGASNIPEALRLAPGVQVSAIGNNKWAISIRGFAERFSNKLLVLVDGRSVYTPLFSGVIWEVLDVPLENIAQIEVIRGPGASIWGANAVNGVINIITKSPFDAQGGHIAVAGGSELKGYGHARYGWSPDQDTAVSLHANLHDYDAAQQVDGDDGVDDWQNQSAGFKLEHLLEDGRLIVQGGLSRTHGGDELAIISASPTVPLAAITEEGALAHLLGRWEKEVSKERQDSLQAYFEHSKFDHIFLREERVTADLEYQQRRKLGKRHDLIWGVGYRYSTDQIDSSPTVTLADGERDTALYSLYAQDDITLEPERWRLTLGARLEHNDYTGFVFQPNLRLLWTPKPNTSAWLSLARAARTPSRVEGGDTVAYVEAIPGNPPFVPPSVVQSVIHRLDNESLDALDLGWRHQLNPTTSFDLTAFYYRYDNMRGGVMLGQVPVWLSGTPGVPSPVPDYVLVQTQPNNADSADVHGLEASLDWRAAQNWRLQVHYSLLQIRAHTGAIAGQFPNGAADQAPSHQVSLRSSLDLSPSLRWDAWLRHVSRIEDYDVPAFTELDMRLAWQPRKDLELSLVAQNLLDSAHPEYGSQMIRSTPSEVQRGFYARLDWKF